MDDRRIDEVFEECMVILEDVKMLEDVLYPERYAKIEGVSLDNIEDDQLDQISSISYSLNYSALSDFSEAHLAGSHVANRRASVGVHYLNLLEKISKQIAGPYIPPTTQQVEDLKKVAYHVLGEIAYFAYYQFDLDKTLESISSGGELEVNVSVKAYCDNTGKRVEDVVNQVKAITESHRPTLTIFEAFPEIESEFYVICAMYIKDFEALEEFLTPDIVLKVVKGEMEPEEAVQLLKDLEVEASKA
jgi:hypothetical protein